LLEHLSTAQERLQRPAYQFGAESDLQCYAKPPFELYCEHFAM